MCLGLGNVRIMDAVRMKMNGGALGGVSSINPLHGLVLMVLDDPMRETCHSPDDVFRPHPKTIVDIFKSESDRNVVKTKSEKRPLQLCKTPKIQST